MPSSLVLRGYQLHQKMNNYLLPGFPINWCKLTRKWKIENQLIRNQFLKASIAIKFLTGILACYIIYLAFHFPIDFQIMHKFVPIMTACVIAISTLIDFILLLYAEDIVGSCNWCNETELFQLYRQMDLYLLKTFKQDENMGKIKLIKNPGNMKIKSLPIVIYSEIFCLCLIFHLVGF